MGGLTVKTLRQLRRPSRDAPTPTLTRRAGLFRLADALRVGVHCLLLPEQGRESIEDYNMGFLRLLGSILFALIPLPTIKKPQTLFYPLSGLAHVGSASNPPVR